MIKQILFCAAFLQAGVMSAQTTAQWIRQAPFFGVEDIKTISYVPGNAASNPAVWTYAEGAVNSGPGGSVTYEYRLMAYNAASGTTVFDQEVSGVDIYKITYDASLDQVLLLVNANAGPAFIGQNTVSPGGTLPDCPNFGLLRFNRSGVLMGTQWLPFPCTHASAGASVWAIDTLLQRVALSMPVYGDFSTDSTSFIFGSITNILRKDSTYIGAFQWSYAGSPLQLNMFVQPFEFLDRSYVTDIAYGNNGDLNLLGNLRGDIKFGSITVSKAANETATFMARIRAGGSIAAAKKVFSSATLGLGPLGLTYNPVNKQLYFANDWSDQLFMNGSAVQKGSTGSTANMLIAATDSNLVTQRFTTVRYGDTTGTLSTVFFGFNNLCTDASGNIVLGATMKDSFRVEQKVFKSRSVNDEFNVAALRFDKDLKLDTCLLSEGTGNEHLSQLTTGPGNEIYIGGRFNGPAVFPPLNINVQSSIEDAFVVKIGLKKTGTTGIGEVNGSNLWSMYPNPATDNLYINLEQMETVSVYTADGRLVHRKAFDGRKNTYVIDVSGFAPGVYFVRATVQQGGSKVRSFVKE